MNIYTKNNLHFVVRAIFANNDVEKFAQLIHETKAIDLADELTNWPLPDVVELLAKISPKNIAYVFAQFNDDVQKNILKLMDKQTITQLVKELPSDEQVTAFLMLEMDDKNHVLQSLSDEDRKAILHLAQYPTGSAGEMTTADYVSKGENATVGETWRQMRNDAKNTQVLSVVYVTDEHRHLLGVVSLQELLMSDDDVQLKEIMKKEIIQVRASDTSRSAIELIERYNLEALPVTDNGGELIGIITVDDAMELLRTSAADSFAKLGGNVPMDGPELDYRYSSFFRMFTVRGFWLAILTLFGILTSSFVAEQEEILSEIIILAAFLAPIVDMGGNTGSQSATLVIRSMALGNLALKWKDFWFVMLRELPVALCLGVGIGLLEMVMAFLFKDDINLSVLWVIGLSMATVTFAGGFLGLVLPFAAKRLNIDPATLSSPLLTSIMDLLGVIIYFAFAYLFLTDWILEVAV